MKSEQLPTRRDFLKLGAASLAGSAFLSPTSCSPESKEKSGKAHRLVYRTLGRTGIKLPVVSMGSVYGINLVHTALDEGIVYIHTSSSYSERNHERLLGEVLRDRPRDSFVVATCPDLPYEFAAGGARSLDVGKKADPALIGKSLDGSLQRMGLDHVDIFYLASVGSREVVMYEPYLQAFDELRKAGKTRFTGVITHDNEPEVIRAVAECGAWDVVLTAFNFRQTHREEIRAAIHQAAEAGIGVVAMKTQAGVYWDRLRLRKINMKAALKWVLKDEAVHTTIPAFSNLDEMYEDLSIMEDLALTPEEERDLSLGEELGLPGLYCQQCGTCLRQCPADLDIPALMRSHMYAFGYQQPRVARQTLRTAAVAGVPCASCDQCSVHCPLGLDVKTNALTIAPILDVPEAFLA